MSYDSRNDTLDHIFKVQNWLQACVNELQKRAYNHDKSKLESPEKEYFDKYTPRLAELTFGTEEYLQNVKELKPALDHHYANNDHHPQFSEKGINGMNLFSITEMLMDWRAATERGKDGDIRKSLEINAERFGISKQLKNILSNTIEYLNM